MLNPMLTKANQFGFMPRNPFLANSTELVQELHDVQKHPVLISQKEGAYLWFKHNDKFQ